MNTDPDFQKYEERLAEREARDRSFQIHGVTLTYRPAVAPEVGWRLEDKQKQVRGEFDAMRVATEKAQKEAEKKGVEPDLAKVETMFADRTSDQEILQVAEDTILACLTVESREGWAALRSIDASHPLTFDDIFELVYILLGKVSRIPTDAPADSSAGRTETDSESKVNSSSPVISLAVSH